MHCAEVGKPLIKFIHCKRSIFSFRVPRRCPLCQQDMGWAKLEDAPVSISTPLCNGHRERCAFLLRPTRGTFLREYDGRSDLHVGITNTNGVVYNYGAQGVQREQAGWEQCLSVPLLQPSMCALMARWDRDLEDFSAAAAWLPHRYDENHHNCYSYTLTFINRVLATEGKGQLDETEFTEKYVVPRTRLASKYITLYRTIEERGFHVTDHPDPGTSP